MNVDWRNRWGRRFVTSVRSQGSAPNCWAFAMTALYESMIRIEHSLWTRRSEGDLARATGKQPWDWGNGGEAHIVAERYGVADPDCLPWSEEVVLYTAKPHGAALSARPLSPTPDRAGRTMRIHPRTLVTMTDVKQKREWIDLVGPMVVTMTIFDDFGAFSTGIYTPSPGAVSRGSHLMLVVGFNDDEQCWIVKNSWGSAWGENGYRRIAYGANMLEPAEFLGVRGTNPDPWSKRRQRTGALVQGGNGGNHNNFELFVRVGTQIEHWYRENANGAATWVQVGPIRSADPFRPLPADAVDSPAVVNSTFNRNYELLYRCSENRLHHAFFDQATGWWFDAKTVAGKTDSGRELKMENPIGIPAFIQSNRGAPGDFEVVAINRSGTAEQWTKHNSAPWTQPPGRWYPRGQFGRDFQFSGPSLVQSRLGVTGSPENGSGELHYVGTTNAGEMQHWLRATGGAWTLSSTFGTGVTSGAALIEGTYGAGDDSGIGNFELCVTVADHIQHWWRHNASRGPWTLSAEFGEGVARVVGLLQGTYATNLELVAERNDGGFQHYWRDGAGWHAGPIITKPLGPTATGNDMQPGEVLYPGQSITSSNGRYTFTYQADGNLVLYGPGGALWASNVPGPTVGATIMQSDGNLVIYGPNAAYVWDSSTANHPGSGLVVQDDGNVVIYDPAGTAVWATHTAVPSGPVATGNDMQPGEVLYPGQSIASVNGRYTFIYQTDGNLVLYGPNGALWASNVPGPRVGVTIMQSDGNLVIYGPNAAYVWDSATANNPGSGLVVQDDGNVVIYDPNGTAVWETNTAVP